MTLPLGTPSPSLAGTPSPCLEAQVGPQQVPQDSGQQPHLWGAEALISSPASLILFYLRPSSVSTLFKAHRIESLSLGNDCDAGSIHYQSPSIHNHNCIFWLQCCFLYSSFSFFFFFSIITNILENVLSPKNKSTAHHSVCLAFFTLCYCVQLPLQRCGSLAFSSALVELTEHT